MKQMLSVLPMRLSAIQSGKLLLVLANIIRTMLFLKAKTLNAIYRPEAYQFAGPQTGLRKGWHSSLRKGSLIQSSIFACIR